MSGVGDVYYCYGHKDVTVKNKGRDQKTNLDRSKDITEIDTSGNKFTFKWEEKGIKIGEIFYEFVDSLEGDDEKFIAGKNNIDWFQTILFWNNKFTFVNATVSSLHLPRSVRTNMVTDPFYTEINLS